VAKNQSFMGSANLSNKQFCLSNKFAAVHVHNFIVSGQSSVVGDFEQRSHATDQTSFKPLVLRRCISAISCQRIAAGGFGIFPFITFIDLRSANDMLVIAHIEQPNSGSPAA